MQKNYPFLFLLCFLSAAVNILPQVGTQVPIAPNSIPQFVDRLPHFAGARVDATSGTPLTITMVPSQQVALSTGTVVTGGTIGVTPNVGLANVWAYRISDGTHTYGPLWPSFTIEAARGVPLNVNYVNGLSGQTYENVGLKVDQTLHWADPLGDMGSFSPYAGAPPVVTHLHGAEVASESDGGPDAWFTPGLAQKGPAWDEGVDDHYYYPNTQEGATLWYHDHALGATRLNVYAGLAGFYFLRDQTEDNLHLPGWSGDNKVQEVDRLTGLPASGWYLPEIEVAIQDRMFDTDGKLFYLNAPPNPNDHPFWTPEFVGDIITVNGKTWPYLSVAPRKYRLRILNGSNARFYELWLQDLVTGTFGPAINQIGTDGGLLDAPVIINPAAGGKLILAPGERADVIIDFSNSPAGAVWTMKNSGRAPYPKGAPPNGSTVGRIMQFVVNGSVNGADASQIPASLRSSPLVKLTNFAGGFNVTPAVKRQLTLNEVMGMGGPLEVLVNNTKWDANGMAPGLGVTETPTEGTTEVWQIINLTADAHPIHLHLVQFQLVGRQKFNQSRYMKIYNALPAQGPPGNYNAANADGAVGGNPAVTPYLQGSLKPANPNERGWKDTFIMYPGEVTTVIVRFAPTDLPLNTPSNQLVFDFDPSEGPGYVWHCHIIDHEDNEMMRPYTVNPNSSRLAKSGAIASAETATGYELQQNYPNPFNPATIIKFSVPSDGLVTLKVYDILGKEVGTLLNQVIPQGNHQVNFDASGLASGMYIYTLTAGQYTKSYKMVLAK